MVAIAKVPRVVVIDVLVASFVTSSGLLGGAGAVTRGIGESYGVVEGVGVAVELLGTGRIRHNGVGGSEFGDGRHVISGVVIEEAEVGNGLVVGVLAGEALIGQVPAGWRAAIVAKGW